MIFGEGPIIKNIAGDLNKLFLQGSRAGQPINVEGSAAANQGTAALMAARDPVSQEISVGMSGEQSARYTVSGTPPLTLPNSLGKPLKAWSVDLLPKQDLNGYDAPWPAGGGVNKLNLEAVTFTRCTLKNANSGSVKLNINNNYFATVTIANDAQDLVDWIIDGQPITFAVDNNNSLALSIVIYGTRTNGSTYLEYTENGNKVTCTPSLFESVKSIDLRFRRAVEAYTDTESIVTGLRLSYGSTALVTYSPYSNLCPIYGTDKLNLFVEESYDPSATPKAVLTLPQTVYTGTIGSEGGESRWGEVDLGTLTWTYNSENNRFDGPIISSSKRWVDKAVTPNAVCECLKTVSFDDLFHGVDNVFAFDAKLLRARCTAFGTDADAFKTAMSGIKLVYELGTPITFAVPSLTIPTSTGSATTWATAEDGTVESMEVTYIGKA